MEQIIEKVSQIRNVHAKTIQRWWNHYLEWGELPHETRDKVMKCRRDSKVWRRTKVVTEEIVQTLDDIVSDKPEYYIDEIAEELARRTGVHLPFSTVYRVLKEKLEYSMQVCFEIAAQRDAMERDRFIAGVC